MTNQRPAADRVRPILAAMERSIDAARRKRTTPADEAIGRLTPPGMRPDAAATPRHEDVSPNEPVIGRAEPVAEHHTQDVGPQKIKARPKRPSSTFFGNDEGIQSRAG